MKDHCNVLLLALSIFPTDRTTGKTAMREGKFLWDGKEYRGIYQLDPVPKMLVDQLSKKHEYLDKIILLCTAQIMDKKMVEITYLDKNKQKDYYQGTALEYFESHIESYMNPEVEDKFVVVPINEKDIEKGISDTIDKVREIKNPSLYLDTHGGFREISLVAEAVISLLKVDGIEAKGIYGVEYGQGENNKIVDARGGFHIFDFVAGMNEFINYGRIDSLEGFLKKNMGTDSKISEQQEKLISCIKEVSEGIQLCNITVFEEGLDKLTEYYKNNDMKKDLSGSSYLFIFAENIKNDYGVLLSDKRTVIDEIKWCRKKGFYQQVLTLIESRVPQYLKSVKICDYNMEKGKDETTVFNMCVPWKYYDKKISREECKNKMNGIWYPRQKEKSESGRYLDDTDAKNWMKFSITEEKKALLDEFLKIHVRLKDIRNQSNHAKDKNKNGLAYVDEKIASYLEKLEELCS